jgi:hypothetical protein
VVDSHLHFGTLRCRERWERPSHCIHPFEVMLVCARWFAAYPLSFRHLEEMMQERGVFVDHSTVHRWALKILPVMALIFRRRKGSPARFVSKPATSPQKASNMSKVSSSRAVSASKSPTAPQFQAIRSIRSRLETRDVPTCKPRPL